MSGERDGWWVCAEMTCTSEGGYGVRAEDPRLAHGSRGEPAEANVQLIASCYR